MKHLIHLTIISLIFLFACKPSNCDVQDFSKTKWTVLDSTSDFFICSKSNAAIQTNDSIEVSFWGTLGEAGIITKSTFDSLAFRSLIDIAPGKFSINDTSLHKVIRLVIPKLSKKSVCFMKHQLGNERDVHFDYTITVYFTEKTDSIKANNWIENLKESTAIFDSVKYKSKQTSFNEMLEIYGYMEPFLDIRLMPSSAELFVKQAHYNQKTLDSFKNHHKDDPLVEDIKFANQELMNSMKKMNDLLKTPFVIRVETY